MELATGAVSLPTALTEGFPCWRHLETAGAAPGSRPYSRHISSYSAFYHAPQIAGSRGVVEERRCSSTRGGLSSCGKRAVLLDVSRPGCHHTCRGDQRSSSRRGERLRWKIDAVAAARAEAVVTVCEDAPSSSRISLHSVQEGDTLTALARQYGATVESIAVLNNIADVNLLQTGQELVIPAPSQGITKGTALVEDFMNNTASSRPQQGTSALASYRNKSTSSVAPAVSGYNAFQVPNLVKLALPLMLIAPVLGFCVRCVVDYIHVHINEEVGRRYAEMETYHARHRPKVKRWQSILDGDRDDSPDLVGVAAFVAVDEVRPVTDWWSQGGHVRNSATEEALEIETEEEQASRQQQDFEEIRKSYAELESTYSKFLTDSGLSRGGYWRGGVH